MQLIGPTRLSGDMSSFTKGEDGLYRVPIVALGERLRDNFGLTIREHSHFDPVDPVHSPNSYHYHDQAIDVQDWRSDDINGVDWRTRTGNLETLLRGSGAEVIGPNSGVSGHDSHLHLAAKDGIFNLNEHQYQTLFGGNAGGKLATFPGISSRIESGDDTSTNSGSSLLPDAGTSTSESGDAIASRSSAKERAQNYSQMSAADINAEYDRIRKDDPNKAAMEGMMMHKAYFGKK